MLADERDVEGVPVLDEDLAVAVEQHAARRAQRQRALVVVLRHLVELLVLDDLEEPEPDARAPKTAAATATCSAVDPNRERRVDRQAMLSSEPTTPPEALRAAAPLDGARQQLHALEDQHADHGVPDRLTEQRPWTACANVPQIRAAHTSR